MLYGDEGDDLLIGDNKNNITTANHSGNDKLYGGAGNDTLYGCGGNDILDAGSSTNYLAGGLGNDTCYVYNSSDDVVEIANGGLDTVFSTVSFAINDVHVENLTLIGTEDDLWGVGNTSVNVITGAQYSDNIEGVANTDINKGDRLIGGIGNDLYYVHSTKDIVLEKLNEGIDTIQVFDLVNQNTGRNTYSLANIANVENLT